MEDGGGLGGGGGEDCLQGRAIVSLLVFDSVPSGHICLISTAEHPSGGGGGVPPQTGSDEDLSKKPVEREGLRPWRAMQGHRGRGPWRAIEGKGHEGP